MKMRIAAFRYIGMDVVTTGTEHLESYSDSYVRISEYVDVDFPPISAEDEVQRQTAALSKLREKVELDYTTKIAEIEKQQAQLAAH
jgi:hypothetical protein